MRNKFIAILLSVAACEASGAAPERKPHGTEMSLLSVSSGPSKVAEDVEAEPLTLHPRGSVEKDTKIEEPVNVWAAYPYQCETFTVYESEKPIWSKRLRRNVYPVNYKRNRKKITSAEQKRNYALARMVAKEMGFDPTLVHMHADHEASGRSDVIHILSPDREANQKAFEKYSYSLSKESALEERLSSLSARESKAEARANGRAWYWDVKSKLFDIRRYKGNRFWSTYLTHEHHIPKRGDIPKEVFEESKSVWSFGYGLYGMNAVLYTHVWDPQAPPWIMCAEDGIVATIMYVWVARDAKAKCDQLSSRDPEAYGSDGGNNRGIIRRMAKGKCGKAKLGPVWQRLMKKYESSYGIDWDASAQVGSKWPAYELYRNGNPKRDKDGRRIPTDRKKILDHMIEKAKKKGLLSDPESEIADAKKPKLISTND